MAVTGYTYCIRTYISGTTLYYLFYILTPTQNKQNKKIKIKAEQVMIDDHKDTEEQPYDDGFLL